MGHVTFFIFPLITHPLCYFLVILQLPFITEKKVPRPLIIATWTFSGLDQRWPHGPLSEVLRQLKK